MDADSDAAPGTNAPAPTPKPAGGKRSGPNDDGANGVNGAAADTPSPDAGTKTAADRGTSRAGARNIWVGGGAIRRSGAVVVLWPGKLGGRRKYKTGRGCDVI